MVTIGQVNIISLWRKYQVLESFQTSYKNNATAYLVVTWTYSINSAIKVYKNNQNVHTSVGINK